MRYIFGSEAKINAKTNVQRISQKIQKIINEHENENEKLGKDEPNLQPKEAWQEISDICRLMIYCKSPEEVLDVFNNKIVPKGEDIQIIRLKPRFNTFL